MTTRRKTLVKRDKHRSRPTAHLSPWTTYLQSVFSALLVDRTIVSVQFEHGIMSFTVSFADGGSVRIEPVNPIPECDGLMVMKWPPEPNDPKLGDDVELFRMGREKTKLIAA